MKKLAIAVTLFAALAVAPAAEARLCCEVSYSGDTAVATGKMRFTGELLHAGMDPAIGACTAKAGDGRVSLRKRFKLHRTPRGYYRFVIVYRDGGDVRTKRSRRFFVRGHKPPA